MIKQDEKGKKKREGSLCIADTIHVADPYFQVPFLPFQTPPLT